MVKTIKEDKDQDCKEREYLAYNSSVVHRKGCEE